MTHTSANLGNSAGEEQYNWGINTHQQAGANKVAHETTAITLFLYTENLILDFSPSLVNEQIHLADFLTEI